MVTELGWTCATTRSMKITLGLSLELLRKNPPSLADTKAMECDPQDWRSLLEGGARGRWRAIREKRLSYPELGFWILSGSSAPQCVPFLPRETKPPRFLSLTVTHPSQLQ